MGGLRRTVLWMDVVAFMAIWSLAFRYGPHTWVWLCGLSIGAAGLVLWIVARRQLGESFTPRAEAHQLVTSGLYSRFRHPIYVFGDLTYFGAFLALQNWGILAAWLVLAAVEQTVRARRENQVLEKRFGGAYREYRSKVWF